MKRIILVLLICIANHVFAQIKYCKDDWFPVQGENRQWGYKNLFGEWEILPLYTKTFPFKGAMAIIQQGLKYGAVDCKGNMVLQPEYDQILEYTGGYAWLKKDDLWGLVDEYGKIILEPQFAEVLDVSEFSDYSWVRQDERWGIFDKFKQDWVYEPQFRVYKHLSKNNAVVKKDGKFGIISYEEKEPVHDFQFSNVIKIAPYRIAVKQNSKWGLLQDDGSFLIEIIYDTLIRFTRTKFLVKKDGLSGLFNIYGRQITPFKYDSILPYSEERAGYYANSRGGYLTSKGAPAFNEIYDSVSTFKDQYAIVRHNDSTSIIDINGNKLFTAREIHRLPGTINFAFKNNSWSVLDNQLKVINNQQFEWIDLKSEGYSRKVKIEGDYFLYQLKYQRLLTEAFDHITSDQYGLSIVSKNDKKGVVNSYSGKTLVPLQFAYIILENIYGDVYAYLKNDEGEVSLYDKQKNSVLATSYDSLRVLNSHAILFGEGKSFGVIDNEGNELIKGKYEGIIADIPSKTLALKRKGKVSLATFGGVSVTKDDYTNGEPLNDGFWVMNKDSKRIVVDASGNEIGAYDFDTIRPLNTVYFKYSANGLWGLLNHRGRTITKALFEEIVPINEAFSLAKKGNLWGVIDRRGDWEVEPFAKIYINNTDDLVKLVGNDRNVVVNGNLLETILK